MLVSPALIPNKQIFRYDPNTDSNYYVFFSKSTVAQAAALYLKHNNHHKATYQHEDRVSGVLTIESWIKEGEQDKSKLYGFDLPDGTWFVKMKIENDEMWSKIKDGELKGLSIEGYFINKMEKMGKQQFSNEEIREAIKELLSVQKIELGSVKELKEKSDKLLKALRDADKTWRNYQDYLTNADKPYGKMIDAYNELDPAVSFAEGTLKRFEKAAKELGVDATNNKNFKDLESYIKESKTVFNIINSFKDPSTFQK